MVSPAYAGENVPPHASADRSGDITTSDRGTLTLTADLGSVRIQTLPATAPPVVHYTVHIETDASEPVAHALLQKYVLTAKETPNGVSLVGDFRNCVRLSTATRNTGCNSRSAYQQISAWK